MTTDTSENFSASHGATLLRLALGTMWITHALLKIFVFTLPGTAQFFGSVGLPGFMAYVVVAVELAGGMALLLGFYGRQASLLLAPVLLVVVWVHWPNGWVFTSPKGGIPALSAGGLARPMAAGRRRLGRTPQPPPGSSLSFQKEPP
jgi:putative oxidoreductase